jgi:hypothetical protein
MDSPEKPGIIGYTRKRMKTNKTKSTTQKTDEQHGYHQAWFTFSHGIHMLKSSGWLIYYGGRFTL